jgi:hypothetical protein
MKKVCFIVSHLGSGSTDLIDILNKNPKCQINQSKAQYDSVNSLEWMFFTDHKCRDSSAIYGDHILYNMSLSCKRLYDFCKFIYVIRPARATLNEIITLQDLKYKEEFAARYYRFRLRRICEMAKRTPGSVLVTWDDLSKGTCFSVIEKYLGLTTQLKPEHFNFLASVNDKFSEKLILQCEDAYERYFYYLQKLNLRRAF